MLNPRIFRPPNPWIFRTFNPGAHSKVYTCAHARAILRGEGVARPLSPRAAPPYRVRALVRDSVALTRRTHFSGHVSSGGEGGCGLGVIGLPLFIFLVLPIGFSVSTCLSWWAAVIGFLSFSLALSLSFDVDAREQLRNRGDFYIIDNPESRNFANHL